MLGSSSAKLSAAIYAAKPALPSRAFLFALALCIMGLLALRHRPFGDAQPRRSGAGDALHFQGLFVSSSSNYTIASYLRSLTLRPHLAGTAAGTRLGFHVRSHFEGLGLETRAERFKALLSYPAHASLTAHFSDGTSRDLARYEPGAEEDGVVRPYHAYSPSGAAYAEAVFANYGREEDYRELGVIGVEVKGRVVIVRRGVVSRVAAVGRAAEEGAAAVLMYTEVDAFREGVERGTVLKGLGDPLTPGWANSGGAVAGGESLGTDDGEVLSRFPKIPSLPISMETAEIILGSLEGGRVPHTWRDTLRSMVGRVGPGPTFVNFTYQEEKKMATVENIFAVIRGLEEPDRYVLLGNHRDAWTFGAVDPNSGTAALLDIARRYSLLMRLGWRPRRTIILCSWDAEEFGMIGSTEWVERNLLSLHSDAVAYLNVDCAVQGPGFFASATPQLDDLLIEVTKKVKDPDSEAMTLYENLTAVNGDIGIQRLSRVDSDFAAFVHHAGVPSVDVYFGKDFRVYHTAFDSYNWMSHYGDPLFHRHVAVAGIWGLLGLRLADDHILPFNYISYAHQLQEYADLLTNLLEESVSLHPLTAAIKELASAANEAKEEAKKLQEEESATANESSALKKRRLNDRLMLAERGFLDSDGLLQRQWFKHLVYGPPGDHGKKLGFFPGVADAAEGSQSKKIDDDKLRRQSLTQHEIWRAARAVLRAAAALKGDFA